MPMATDSFHLAAIHLIHPPTMLFHMLPWSSFWSTHSVMSPAVQNPAKSPLDLKVQYHNVTWKNVYSAHPCYLFWPHPLLQLLLLHLCSPIWKLPQLFKYTTLKAEFSVFWLDSFFIPPSDPQWDHYTIMLVPVEGVGVLVNLETTRWILIHYKNVPTLWLKNCTSSYLIEEVLRVSPKWFHCNILYVSQQKLEPT